MSSKPVDVVMDALRAMNRHDADAAAMCASEDVEIVSPTGVFHGRDGVRVLARAYMTAFPDAEWVIAHQVTAGDTVVTEYLLEGTHSGELGTIPPTGRRVSARMVDVSRVRNGEIYSVHLYWDNLALMQALGVAG